MCTEGRLRKKRKEKKRTEQNRTEQNRTGWGPRLIFDHPRQKSPDVRFPLRISAGRLVVGKSSISSSAAASCIVPASKAGRRLAEGVIRDTAFDSAKRVCVSVSLCVCVCMCVYVGRVLLSPYATIAAHNGDSDLSRSKIFLVEITYL